MPSEFSKRHLTNQPATVTLQVLDGRSWSVQLKYYHERAKVRFQNCWPLFVRGNNLKVGDVCVFTLINCSEFLFEVVFYPVTEAANCPLSPGNLYASLWYISSLAYAYMFYRFLIYFAGW